MNVTRPGNEGTEVLQPLRRTIAAIESAVPLDRLAEPLEAAAKPLSRGTLASVLRGEWLGHALHPLLTDFPLGCWMSACLLDLIGGRSSRKAAQRLIGVGLLMVPPTAASGMSDWSKDHRPRVRRVGVVHALGNTLVAMLYLRSWKARRRGSHFVGVLYGMTGGLLAWFTGYLGGHLSLAYGVGRGERGGVGPELPLAGPSGDGRAPGDELVDEEQARTIIGVPLQQIDTLVEEGLLNPVQTPDGRRFRHSEALAVHHLGG
jgi:uncharacterized membrane protein